MAHKEWPCPHCGSNDLRDSHVPGGADRVCKNCGCNFDLFPDGPGAWIVPDSQSDTAAEPK
jgi:hypothetical protein